MEVAIRLINLYYCYRLILPTLNASEKKNFYILFAQHSHFLKRFPEISDVPGNHYLFTEVGVILSCILQGEKYDSENFNKIIENQFNCDGFHIEHATVYHRLCLDVSLLGYLLLKELNGRHLEIEATLKKAKIALLSICSSEGKLPVFGDSDSGLIFNFGQSSRSTSLYTTEAKSSAESIHHLFYDSISPLFSQEFSKPEIVRDGYMEPYFVLSKGEVKLIVRVGKLGLSERAPHDHDDFLSFWLFKGNKDIFIEGGAAPYTLSSDVRDKYVAAGMHNCISTYEGYRAGFKTGSIFNTVDKDSFDAAYEYDGDTLDCEVVCDHLRHRRKFRLTDDALIISEEVLGDVSTLVSRFFISVDAHEQLKIESASSYEKRLIDWYEEYGHKADAVELSFKTTERMEYKFFWE